MKKLDFKGLFTEARKDHAYWVEGAILEFTEDMARCMEEQGVSRSELARRIGTSPAYVTKILRGTTNFTLDTMVKVARALDCEFRCHLQPQGAETRWFDVFRNAEEMKSRDAWDVHETLGEYSVPVRRDSREVANDSLALAG